MCSGGRPSENRNGDSKEHSGFVCLGRRHSGTLGGQSASVTACGGTGQNVNLGKCLPVSDGIPEGAVGVQSSWCCLEEYPTLSHSPRERPNGLSLVLPEEGELGEKRTRIPPMRVERGR